MKYQVRNSTVSLIQGDITEQTTDVIVNAANSQLAHGGGVAKAIANKAGPALQQESREAADVSTGQVHTTTAGDLSAEYVIHAVGPVWHGGDQGEDDLLQSCIHQSLQEADRLGCKSISFPAISTGIYGYPLEQASTIILSTILAYLRMQPTKLQEVVMVLFAEEDYRVFSATLQSLTE